VGASTTVWGSTACNKDGFTFYYYYYYYYHRILPETNYTFLAHNAVACLLEARTVAPENTSETTFVSRQRLGKHVPAATDKHATIKVLLETVFSTRSMPRSYKEDSWGNRVSSVWKAVKKRIQLVGSRRSERT
jgi:hypothetical protein